MRPNTMLELLRVSETRSKLRLLRDDVRAVTLSGSTHRNEWELPPGG